MTTNEAPERIALRWETGAAVTNGPLMTHPDYTRYVREDVAQSQKENAHKQGWDAGWKAAMASTAKPRVKPLVWEARGGYWVARTPFDTLRIIETKTPHGKYHEITWSAGRLHDTLEAAQTVAQADYEARILSALVLP